MATKQCLGEVRTIRVLANILELGDIDEEDTAPDTEDSDIEDDSNLEQLLVRNRAYLNSERANTVKWNVQDQILENDETISVVIKPTASEMNYKLLHPSFYCDLNYLGELDDLATLVNAPDNWKQQFDQHLVSNQIILDSFNTLKDLPDYCPEGHVSHSFTQLVSQMAFSLGIQGISSISETPIAVSGLLVDSSLFLRSNTDVHFTKYGRNVIGTELKSAAAYPEGAVWYRGCRGIQALSAMYAYKCPIFVANQKHWKLILLNSNSDGILTYPFDRTEGTRAGSTQTKRLGPTFLQALCICLLSVSHEDEDAPASGTSAVVVMEPTPESKRGRPRVSEEKAAKKARAQSSESEPHSGGKGGKGVGKRMLSGEAVHQRVRVLADCDVRAIEGRIAAAELASVLTRRAEAAGKADVVALQLAACGERAFHFHA
uniref:Uncharacterized protein n=1 Tax=Cryptomonas curvata TaxID=233186 RepID=A0A7S0LWX7_9CRYP|mmetsp:Transcript_10502/g.22445  ORF Transcript_10502/g.22445 Transcript_10502/m.22445 type:complete len:431 (+) Transcript_10502:161-1453(+)|eukprot:CAMPEP_0172185962 /NCGR_PEP_ID=MMETSP1050-20130122/20465_1 /TAXON_ID=233186 /ORGANISM="Cryptomonas curvata, Strain CCAP979/52" /LENGTH=430 /DNA_ID=CAMNT_0012860015 /DNA_START=150 /DNA_END=1442 /DNA_ORIENTATION=-